MAPHTLSALSVRTGALQAETTTEIRVQVIANATAVPSTNSTAGDDEDRMTTSRPPSSTSQQTGAVATPSPSSNSADRINEDSSVHRDQGLDTEGVIGIAAGCVAVVGLAVAFVHMGSTNKRKKQAQQSELMTQDLASSTMSVKDAKYVESFDSSAGPPGSPRTSTIAAIRKPTVPHRLPGGGSMYTTTSSKASRTTVSEPAPALVQSSTSTSVPQAAAATIVDVDEHFHPSRLVRTFSRSQRAASGHKAPLSPESYLKFAQSNSKNNFRQSRRSSRHSHAMKSPNSTSSAASSIPSPALSQRSRFSRRTSLHSSSSNTATRDESAADIPMLGGGMARSSSSSSQNDPTSLRDIPVLARGSEESVDSVEDDDVEISI